MTKKRHWFFDSRKCQVRTGTVPEYVDGHLIRTHSHPWHQLIYASRGVMTVRTPSGAWVVPTNRGVWVPAHTRHSVQMSGPVSLRTLYLLPSLDKSLPDRCHVVGISPLLRELILRIVELDTLSIRRAAHAHLISVLLDHLQVMKSDPIHLPLPREDEPNESQRCSRKTPPKNDRSPSYRRLRARANAPSSASSSWKPDSASANGASSSSSAMHSGCWPAATQSRRSRWMLATTVSARSFPRFE
jgi:hypothetical protein